MAVREGVEPRPARYQLRHLPMRAPGAIRTRDPQIRNLVLYPLSHGGMVSSEGVEPTISALSAQCLNQLGHDDTAEREGFEPSAVSPAPR